MTVAAPLILLAASLPWAETPPIEKTTEVGPVTAVVRIEPAEPLIGDPVYFTLEVTAQPGVELIMPDFGEDLQRFTIINFTPAPERLDERGRTVATQLWPA